MLLSCVLAVCAFAVEPSVEAVHESFVNPPVSCKPHTRWWWMGNAMRKEDIRRQLEQMKANGFGGVEQISMQPMYEKGGCEYLSPEYFELLRYAVEQARELGLEFSVNFGGPGWVWGGTWVPKEDQSANLIASVLELQGPQTFSGSLSDKAVVNPRDGLRSTPVIAPEDRLVKVVAGRVENGRLRADSLVDLSDRIQGRTVTWQVPEGQWQLMGFWMTQRDNSDAVNHVDEGAMARLLREARRAVREGDWRALRQDGGVLLQRQLRGADVSQRALLGRFVVYEVSGSQGLRPRAVVAGVVVGRRRAVAEGQVRRERVPARTGDARILRYVPGLVQASRRERSHPGVRVRVGQH